MDLGSNRDHHYEPKCKRQSINFETYVVLCSQAIQIAVWLLHLVKGKNCRVSLNGKSQKVAQMEVTEHPKCITALCRKMTYAFILREWKYSYSREYLIYKTR